MDSRIYGMLRHPVYSAALRVGFALVLWNGSAFALVAGWVAPLVMSAWLRWVEEPELIQRFGEARPISPESRFPSGLQPNSSGDSCAG